MNFCFVLEIKTFFRREISKEYEELIKQAEEREQKAIDRISKAKSILNPSKNNPVDEEIHSVITAYNEETKPNDLIQTATAIPIIESNNNVI